MSESNILRRIMVAISAVGARVMRNNVGCLKDARGHYIHYGLGTGSSDLVGWVPVKITESMIGQTIAVFLAIEVKTDTGRVTEEQQDFIFAVNKAGGCAFVARSPEDAIKQLSQ